MRAAAALGGGGHNAAAHHPVPPPMAAMRTAAPRPPAASLRTSAAAQQLLPTMNLYSVHSSGSPSPCSLQGSDAFFIFSSGVPELSALDGRLGSSKWRPQKAAPPSSARNQHLHDWHHRRRRKPQFSTDASLSAELAGLWAALPVAARPLSCAPQGVQPTQFGRRSVPGSRPRENDRMRRNCFDASSRQIPPERGIPPERVAGPWAEDTGIASEKEWGISLERQPINESGLNEDGSTWYREGGEDHGENGYRCRWNVMGGRTLDGSVEWKETWWEKSDWTGYKELGAEKSGRNQTGDSWWETWQEVFRQDEWSGLARIEKSAHKQAKSRTGGVWNEKWWERYNAKGWTEKGAHKYGRLNDQSWWEKWGEQYDGRGAVVKWTDKWAETDTGTKWGDKWEERFNNGTGTRQGETWHVLPVGDRWSRTWGEEHYGNGDVHKYGKSTSGEVWDAVVKESTFYESEPHYGWGEAIANSLQLLAIEIREKPPMSATSSQSPPSDGPLQDFAPSVPPPPPPAPSSPK